jgi:hypothetical protein
MPLPSSATLDDVKLKIRTAYQNPNVGQIYQAVLRDGPRIFRIATLLEILDGKTRAFHHFSLKIDSIDRKKRGWFSRPERSIRLEGDDPNEIEHLFRFLKTLHDGKLAEQSGDVRIIKSEDYANLEALIEALPRLATPDKLEVVKAVLSRIDSQSSDVDEFIEAFAGAHLATVENIATASRIVQHRAARDELQRLVNTHESSEQVLQRHLAQNPWMFGSEYSQLLDRRTWTRDDRLDFMLRRTVDGFLEIIEIKTPFKERLLQYDQSHDSYYPSSKLSLVIGQVMRYIEEIERSRDSIRSKDGYDPLKIRARIIIGRDGNDDEQSALRNLNAHLHRVEIITFDQLLKIAERVLGVFETATAPPAPSDDEEIPF